MQHADKECSKNPWLFKGLVTLHSKLNLWHPQNLHIAKSCTYTGLVSIVLMFGGNNGPLKNSESVQIPKLLLNAGIAMYSTSACTYNYTQT